MKQGIYDLCQATGGKSMEIHGMNQRPVEKFITGHVAASNRTKPSSNLLRISTINSINGYISINDGLNHHVSTWVNSTIAMASIAILT